MLKTLPALMIGMLALSACSSPADMAAAEQEVPKFHGDLDQGRFVEIYAGSADDLKKVTTQEDFVALLEAVHRKLGDTKSSSKQNWNVNFHTSGTFVTLTYKTVYAEGEAAEQFVYRIEGQSALLVGYHINSNALIIK
jgi:opacity protein-like surface antigen